MVSRQDHNQEQHPGLKTKKALLSMGFAEWMLPVPMIQRVAYNRFNQTGIRTKLVSGLVGKLLLMPKINHPVLLLVLIITVIRGLWPWHKWLLQPKTNPNRELLQNKFSLFIGCYSGNERLLMDEFVQECKTPVVQIWENNLGSTAKIFFPPLNTLVKEIWQAACALAKELPKLQGVAEWSPHAPQLATSMAFDVGVYAYARSWCRGLTNLDIHEVRHTTFNYFSRACFDFGIAPVVFRQHGWMRHSYTYHGIHKALMLSKREGEVVAQELPGVTIEIVAPPSQTMKTVQAVVFLTSIFDTPEFRREEYIDVLEDLIGWCKQQKLKLIVRTHPREDVGFWAKHFPDIIMDSNQHSFQQTLQNLQPLFMASWISTTLVEGLKDGVIPVLLGGESISDAQDFVLDIKNVAMDWRDPQTRELLSQHGLQARDKIRQKLLLQL